MHFLPLLLAIPALVGALPAAAPEDETPVIFDTDSPIDEIIDTTQRDGGGISDEEPPNDIVGGYQARRGEFPSTLSLLNRGSHICGAALINPNTVLTAAHCVDAGGSFGVVAGSLTWQSGGVFSPVSQVIIHSGYNGNNLDNDFAILKLSQPIFEDVAGTVRFARLPPAGSDPAQNTMSVVAGWGATRAGGPAQRNLLAVQVPIVHPDTCARLVAPRLFSRNMICAGFPEGGRDSCQGDSGGPLYNSASREVLGVVSWGLRGCAAPQNPGVYARVSTAISFIQRFSG